MQSFAGKKDGDNESQVAAVENLISAGAKGFMITANDSKGIVPSLDKARQAGLLVIALDTPIEPADAADGVAGPVTQGRLAAAGRQSSRAGGTGLEIDLERQILMVVRGGQVQGEGRWPTRGSSDGREPT